MSREQFSEAHGRKQARDQERAAKTSVAGRDIAPLPSVADVGRRLSCRKSLRKFCETYNPQAFALAWSDSHLQAIARIEEAATLGALYAFAMPRGSGKTTLCRMAALWAVSYGWRRYVFIIAANQQKAEDSLDSIKAYVRFLEDYAADFPEISHPAKRIGGVAQRALGQLYEEESTCVEWGKDRIVCATIAPPENWPAELGLRSDGKIGTSGAVISASGLTGEGIRGSALTLTTGETVRPDLVLIDDPQTNESAWSITQNETREQLISADVLGMAGPGKTLSAVMPCTVIAPDDMVDRVLDRARHPLWRGQRTKMLTSMPKNLSAWDRHFDIYRACALKEPPDFAEANADYVAHRAELDEGAAVSWPDRKLESELSAVQHAMYLFCRDPRAFAAEYQNEPLARLEEEEQPDPRAISERVNRTPRGRVPASATRLTAFVDVQKELLYYAVIAWDDGFGGSAIDYGTYPDQKRAYFTLRDAKYTLPLATKVAGLEAQLYAGLDALTKLLLGREWQREDGAAMRLERCLIDANWGQSTEIVKKFCRQSIHAAVLMPSHGKFVGASSNPICDRKAKPGERMGLNWFIQAMPTKGLARAVIFDTNWWKTFLHARLATPRGGRGGLDLFGDTAGLHSMLADHLCAELRVKVEGRGRVIDEWRSRPDRRDNHWLDCFVGCAVAASMGGSSLKDLPPARPPARKTVSFSELQRQAKERQGTGTQRT